MKKTVVIVEDDAGIRNQLIAILKGTPDIDCLYAVKSAEQALEKIPLFTPDIVLMDIKLPGMSGIECIPLLKEKVENLEVLVLSIYEEEDLIYNALKAGANGYLLKSSDPEVLLSAIRDIYAGGTPFSSHIARKVVHYLRHPPRKDRSTTKTEHLTPRELELLELIAAGFINKEISEKMGITLESVRTYVKRIYTKLHVRNRTEAALKHFEQRKT